MKRVLILVYLLVAVLSVYASAQSTKVIVDIDSNPWELTRRADHCSDRVATAVQHYQTAPIYHPTRRVYGDRFLINSGSDCWIELSIEGVDDVSLLIRVSEDRMVLDQRSLSSWGLKVYPYPSEPNGL